MAHSRSARGRAKSSVQRGSQQGSVQSRSQRQLRVGEELRHALSRILARGELRDPHLAEVSLTVTEVRISPDLKSATAFVVPLGGGELKAVIDALNHAAGFLRSQLGQEIELRYTPRLSFQADHSFDEAARINALLHHPRVAQDVEAEEAENEGPENEDGELPEPDADGR